MPKKLRWKMLWLIAAAWFSLGMGQMGSVGKVGEVPPTELEVKAILTDNVGTTLTLTQFSINGQVFLSGRLGAGRLSIPFSRIRLLTFTPLNKGQTVRVELNDRSQLTLVVDKDQTAYGRLQAGAYRIPLEQVKQIEIQEVAERKR